MCFSKENLLSIVTPTSFSAVEYSIDGIPGFKLYSFKFVQRRATKMVPGLADLTYDDRLKRLKLPTLTNVDI
jgi:hypothetical protein